MFSSGGWADEESLSLRSCQAIHCLRQSAIVSQPCSSPALLITNLGSSQHSNKCRSLHLTRWCYLGMLPPSHLKYDGHLPFCFDSFLISLLCLRGCFLNVHHNPRLEGKQFQWLAPKLVATQNCRKTYWGSSSPRYSLIHCRGSWWQHPVLRSLKPFYYRKSLWPFILRISHISGVCRRCLIFSRGNPLGPLFVPWNSI